MDKFLLLGGHGNSGNATALFDETSQSWKGMEQRSFARRRMTCTKMRDNGGLDFVLVAG